MRWIGTALLVTALLSCPATGQGGDSTKVGIVGSEPIIVGQKITFYSKILGEEVTMNLALPESFDGASESHTYPVVFVNGSHGRSFFPVLTGLVRHLASRERMPESIVVSLHDVDAIPEVHTNGMWSAETLGPDGNPEASVRHLREELIPFLEREYRANHYRLMIGVSGSALFPLYTLTEAPDLFDGHILIASADMIGMGYQPGKTFLDALEAGQKKDAKRRVKLYLGTADDDLKNRPNYRSNLAEAASRFTKYEAFDVEVEILPRTDHYEAFLQGVMAGLDQHFPKESWSARYRDLVAQPGDALANIDRYYEDLSKEYGFRILPRADRWNSVNCLRFMVRHLVGLERTKEAVAVAQRRIDYQPREPMAYLGLADALEADGQIGGAVAALEKSVELARGTGARELQALEARLEDLKRKIG